MLGETRIAESRRLWAGDIAVFVGGLAFLLSGITSPSLWRDEVATAEISRGGLAAIRRIVELTDLVHAPYYVLQTLWTSVVGHSEFALRLPSAVAMAAAAAMLAAIARQYTTAGRAVVVAVVFLAAPAVTRYGQEARSPALVLALVTAATLFLHHRSRWGWVGYGVVTTLAVLLSIVAVMALLPHAVLARHVRLLRTWLLAAVAPFCIAVVWALLLHTGGQRSRMLDWLAAPTLWRLGEMYVELCASAAFATALVVGWVLLARRRSTDVLWIAVFAAVPAVGWMVSHAVNVALGRYFVFVLPYLVLGAVLPWHRRILVYAGLTVAVAMPENILYRTGAGHQDDFRAAVAFLDGNARLGDGVAHGSWLERFAYDYYARRGVAQPLVPDAATLEERQREPGGACEPSALRPMARVWLLRLETTDEWVIDPGECDSALVMTSSRDFGDASVELYVRRRPPVDGQPNSAAAR